MIYFIKKNYFPIILILFPLLFFYPIIQGYVLFPGDVLLKNFYPWKETNFPNTILPWTSPGFYGADPILAFYPWKMIGIEMMKNWQWPLWNPYSFAGSPLLANSSSALLYPLNILYFIFNFTQAWSFISILQIILASLFCYLFLKENKLSKYASFWGALIYGWNGFTAFYFHLQVVGHTLVWLPLILFLILRVSQKKISQSLHWIILLIFSLASMLLAGFLQIALYNLILIFSFCLVFCKKFPLFLLIFIISLCFASAQLLPTAEYLIKISRETDTLYSQTAFYLSPLQLIKFLAPRFFGHPNTSDWWGKQISFEHMDNTYIGILGILFALIGIYYVFKEKRNRFWVFISAMVLGLIIKNPLTDFIYNLPLPLISSITPARGQSMLILPVTVLSALAIDKLIKIKLQFWKGVYYLILLIDLLTLLSYFYISNIYSTDILGVVWHSLLPEIIVINFLAIFLFLFFKRKISLSIFLLLIFLIQSTDLLRENKFFTRNFIDPVLLYPPTNLTDFLSANKESRFLSLDYYLLTPNSFLPYKISTITAFDSTHLKYAYQFAKDFFPNKDSQKQFDPRCINYPALDKKVINFLNIRYVLNRTPLEDKGLRLVNKFNSIYVYENIDVLPRAYFVKDFEVVGDKDIPNKILDPTFDPTKKVFLDKNPNLIIDQTGNNKSSLLTDNVKLLTWHSSSDQEQLLFFSETFDEGWEAYIDNQKTKIYRANLTFQTIAVPSGEHEIKFVYSPQSFKIGIIITLVVGVLISLVMVYLILKRLRIR